MVLKLESSLVLRMDTFQKLVLVYGYIRIHISFLDIPSDVMNLVDLFLIFKDEWDKSYTSNKIEINTNDNSITTKNGMLYSPELRVAYGEAVIDDTSGVQSWKLKINHSKLRGDLLWFMVIGIATDDHEMLCKSITFPSRWGAQRHSYGFITGKGQKKWVNENNRIKKAVYGEPNQFKKQGDKMEIILNVKEGTLRYIVNEKDYGIAFDNIDKTQKYRLAIRLCHTARDCVFELQ